MHFVSLKDTAGSQLAAYAKFYSEKFPAAFQVEQEDEASGSEEQEVQWTSPEHKKAFSTFEDQIKKTVKDASPTSFLKTLLKFKPQICELPVSTKQAECTVQRFMLYMLPVLNLCEYEESKTMLVQFVNLLVDCDKFSVPSKVNSLLHMYNACARGLKAIAFEKLVSLCANQDCFEILSTRARDVVRESAKWELSDYERKELYQKVARSLDQQKDIGAFKVLHSFLYLHESASESEIANVEVEARRCVILAIKTSNVINFEELLDLKTIKTLVSLNS